MDTTTVDKRIAALRAEDGPIEERLAELDTKLATWLAAMREGQAALLGGVKRVASAAEAGPAPAPATELDQAKPADSGAQADPAPRRAPPPETAERLAPAPETGPAPRQAAAVDSDQAPSSEAPTPEDDEALLGSLDADTANAIRVKRRLTGDKRTVRKLLEEIRSTRPAVKEAGPKPKRRWRLRNE